MIIIRSIEGEPLPLRGSCVALGFFDGLHLGHRTVIGAAAAAAKAEHLSACVFTFTLDNARPQGKMSAKQLLSLPFRDHLLEDWGITHLLCPNFSSIRAMEPEVFVESVLVRQLGAKHLFCGENHRFGKGARGDTDTLRQLAAKYGMTLDVLPLVQADGETISCTRIRALVADGDMPAACALLGRPYTIDFEVTHGRSLARSLGAPTINQTMPADFACPRFGVYATTAVVNGQRYAAVTNVGVKPTVGSDRVLAETYIIDYDGDLYDCRVLVEFHRFIRAEQRFDDLQGLCDQIALDAKIAKEITSSLLSPNQ